MQFHGVAIHELVPEMDILAHNRRVWDKNVERLNRWTIPVTEDEVARARRGELELLLTPTKAVPRAWYPPLVGTPTLCLASGGGQQGPLLAAAGAVVTVYDNSPKQLGQDRFVAEREGLAIETIAGDMADLSIFPDATFELIFHPCSNCFAADIRPVWRECFRVLRPGGVLMAGFVNPARFLFDERRVDQGFLEVRHALPYSDLDALSAEELQQMRIIPHEPFEFGHSLTDQIGGQLAAGFVLTDLFEDRYPAEVNDPVSRLMDSFIATRAIRVV